MKECAVCRRCKYETSAHLGLLQPLTIPTKAWSEVSMNVIEDLPSSKGNGTILVVVDLSHPFSAMIVAQAYIDNIYKLHGLPDSIVSDRDKVFISSFWQELFRKLGTRLHLSIAYHPESNGQTEVLNRCLEGYLRCMTR